MKFTRNTHDENGNVRSQLPKLNKEIDPIWPKCDLNFLRHDKPKTIEEIYQAHEEYDEQWYPEGYGFSLPEIMEGLATHLRLGTVKISKED